MPGRDPEGLGLFFGAAWKAVPEAHAVVHRVVHPSEVRDDNKLHLAAVRKLATEEGRLGCRRDVIAASQGQDNEHGCEQATMHK